MITNYIGCLGLQFSYNPPNRPMLKTFCLTLIQNNPFAKVTFHKVDEEYDGQRLDNFLIRLLKGVPKSRIYRLLRKGEVRVNKGRAKPDMRLNQGDSIVLLYKSVSAEPKGAWRASAPGRQKRALFFLRMMALL